LLPETDVARVRRWVDARNEGLPERARRQIRYELDVADRHLTQLECRPRWRPEYGPDWTRFPIVRFHYTTSRRVWAIYGRDRNLKFPRYDPVAASRHIVELLDAVDHDPSGIFWG
jgi:Protein of unknown function (DUF3024)